MSKYPEAVYPLDKPVKTEFIHTKVKGPKPCNTLVFLRCKGVGGQYETSDADLIQYKTSFTTAFHIDGYAQANHAWHYENTLVSATAFVQLFNITSDLEFVFGIDVVEWFLHSNGNIGFRVSMSQQLDGRGLFEYDAEMTWSYTVSAYVLLYEPRVELPPTGNFGQRPALEAIPPLFATRKEMAISDNPGMIRRFSSFA